jgi:hypothetical protein
LSWGFYLWGFLAYDSSFWWGLSFSIYYTCYLGLEIQSWCLC